MKICELCGAEFNPSKYNASVQRFCSEECQRAWWNAHRKKGWGSDFTYVCQHCGKTYTTKYRDRDRYCSRACCFAHKKWTDEKERACKAKRRALERGAYCGERIDPQEVYERDGWICQLCHKKVNRCLKWPHKMSASLDHIIPVDKGGKHTWANVQLAHLKCNCSKGNRGSGQLKLYLHGDRA